MPFLLPLVPDIFVLAGELSDVLLLLLDLFLKIANPLIFDLNSSLHRLTLLR